MVIIELSDMQKITHFSHNSNESEASAKSNSVSPENNSNFLQIRSTSTLVICTESGHTMNEISSNGEPAQPNLTASLPYSSHRQLKPFCENSAMV